MPGKGTGAMACISSPRLNADCRQAGLEGRTKDEDTRATGREVRGQRKDGQQQQQQQQQYAMRVA